MIKARMIQRGDVFLIDPNPQAGREMKDNHRFIAITPKEINQLGVVMTVPVTSGRQYARMKGLTVPIMGYDTAGVAVCNQVRTFDIDARIKARSAKYIETLDDDIMSEIVLKVMSVIDPR